MRLSTPGPTLGVVGAGQLGRMLGEAAGPLGVEVVALDPTPDPPAAPVVRETVTADFDDYEGLRAMAEWSDVLTYEIELADPDLLERVSEETDTPVHPTPGTLRTIEDKLVQNQALADAGVPVPAFQPVSSPEEVRTAGERLGYPLMLKARRGGYDGRGNVAVEGPDEATGALAAVAGADAATGAREDVTDPDVPDDAAMVEEMVPFERELSVIGASGDDAVATFPATETVHREEILRETVVPARTAPSVRERADAVAREVLDVLDGRGVYGIELFEVEPGSSQRAVDDGDGARSR